MSEYLHEFCLVYVLVLPAKERTISSYGTVGVQRKGLLFTRKVKRRHSGFTLTSPLSLLPW